jgi:hypothetical protein
MGVSQGMKGFVARLDAMADPASAFGVARRGAGIEHAGERGVASDGEALPTQRSRQGLRQVKVIERQYRPQLGLDPEYVGIVARIRHREDPAAVGEHEQLGFDRRHGRMHAWIITDRRRQRSRNDGRLSS